ncbi:hypothetical protein OIE62_00440 [Streptomyces scopuliridis]|uniref:Uncharacterized protein n=1 Tax=Streptomyces scopuliridis TaxID=452529 RepID=A0ACD4ZX57_9ACTN|nr:hypothetical protein [Streptomyces scopuliridis]WSB38356.1 hypothetical protein OG949_39820 [Streptomyces scopuliridis]WSC02800.1 hypothetical protein OG835_41390 [Streptomyces scopuliridis]WSC03666.1 hypothetical protein OIE62_00440 [Streptomyces scopuliridis]
MNDHPDIHPYLHAARAADLQAQARAWERTVSADHAGRGSTPVRARLGWLLVETGLRLLHSATPSRPAEG